MKHFVLTIYREFGAEGHEIGKVLSEKLGIKLLDKELLERAALKSGSAPEYSGGHDEAVENHFLDSIGTDGKQDQLFQQESQVILDAYSSGSCIIVGRLADFILRHEPDVLNAYIFAPEEFRINNIAQKHNVSVREAKRLVRKMDTARENYYRFYSLGKWNTKKGKDIWLNRETFGVNGCASILENAIQNRFGKDDD